MPALTTCNFFFRLLLVATLPSLTSAGQATEDEFIIVQSTTSTQASGLYETLLPKFRAASGVEVRVVAVGTGQAMTNAENCDGDVLLVHARSSEETFVEKGFGKARTNLMYNDFIIVGPTSDPAGIAGMAKTTSALRKLASSETPFASRGDDSGTHQAELMLWQEAGIDPMGASGDWYRETGSGMGPTLNVASGMDAYTLTDRATWISFRNKGNLRILVEGDPALFNQYGVIMVNPEHCPTVRQQPAEVFIDWLLSDEGQAAIDAHEIDGQQLFFANAP